MKTRYKKVLPIVVMLLILSMLLTGCFVRPGDSSMSKDSSKTSRRTSDQSSRVDTAGRKRSRGSREDSTEATGTESSAEELNLPPMFTVVENTESEVYPQFTTPEYPSDFAGSKNLRYHERRLTPDQRKSYEVIAVGLAQRSDSIGPLYLSNQDELRQVIDAVFYDCPEYFWFLGGYTASSLQREGYLEITIAPNYRYSAQEYLVNKACVEEWVKPIISQLSGKSDYEKVKGVYEYLIDHTCYDWGYIGTSIFDLLSDGRGVCEGYARTAQHILTKLGVETLYVTGFSGELGDEANWENHAWNIVNIDGDYYHLDVTWGDPLADDGTQTKNYYYLNVTDWEIARSHRQDDWTKYPACNAVEYNYYVYEGNYLEIFRKDTITRWFQQAYAQGVPLEFKASSEDVYWEAYTWLVDNGGLEELFISVTDPNAGFSNLYYHDEKMLVFKVECA